MYRIQPSEFDHGATRNLGISLSRGEYVALTVQDAVPLDGRWLSSRSRTLSVTNWSPGCTDVSFPIPTVTN